MIKRGGQEIQPRMAAVGFFKPFYLVGSTGCRDPLVRFSKTAFFSSISSFVDFLAFLVIPS
jgi:hypothetical protein